MESAQTQKQKLYSALDVSRYVINYSNKKDYGVSCLKLQKLLYFIQAYFLLETDRPCFAEPIEAWGFGPVVPAAYNEYKQFGSCNIPAIHTYLEINHDNIWNSKRKLYTDDMITQADKKRIEKVVDFFADYAGANLTEITLHQAPWKDAYQSGQRVITNEQIIKYFKSDRQ